MGFGRRRFAWSGSGALGVLTASGAHLAYEFRTMAGPERFASMSVFIEHIGPIGGLAATAPVAGARAPVGPT
jgi:hypothetical protein